MKRTICCNRSGLALLTVTLACSPAWAGGLWLNEYGSPVQGRAGAGAQAGTDDASTAFHNPAAMSRLDQSELMLTGGFVYPTTEYDIDRGSPANGNGNGGEAGETSPGGSLFYVHPLNDRWSFGFSGLALSGAGLDYDRDWAGRFQAQKVEILIAGVVPSVSYRINDRLSVGASVPVMYGDLTMKVAVPNPLDPANGAEGQAKIKGDDVQVGLGLGALFEISQSTRIGAYYQTGFDFEFGGDVTIEPPSFEVGVSTDVQFAPVIRASLSHDITRDLRGHLSFGWDGWSEMDNIMLSTSSGGSALPRNWHDTYHSAIGLEYQLNDAWKVQTGLAYDTDPTNAIDRTADMPMDSQTRYGFGVEHVRDSGLKLAASLVYADYGDGKINSARNPPAVGWSGELDDNDIVFFSLSADWTLGQSKR